jgi:hypothetical protein
MPDSGDSPESNSVQNFQATYRRQKQIVNESYSARFTSISIGIIFFRQLKKLLFDFVTQIGQLESTT